MVGLLEGIVLINDLLEYGDLGIVMFIGFDGEVIFVDGKVYYVNEYKEFIELIGDEMILYVIVIKFKVDLSFKIFNKN